MFTFDPEINWNTIIQFIGFVVGIVVVGWQLHRQNELQKLNHQIQIKKEIYKELTDRMELSSPAGISVTLDIMIGLLEKGIKKKLETGKYQPPVIRFESIVGDFKSVHSKLYEVAGTIEKYEIIGENQPLFRRAFVAKTSEFHDAFMPILLVLPYFLLSENGIKDPEKLLIPSETDIIEFKNLINSFREVASDVDGFLYDIQVEAQNILLGDLFNRKLSIRKPLDSRYLVLSSQEEAHLEKVKSYIKEKETI